MDKKQLVKVQTKNVKPKNVILNEYNVGVKCREYEKNLPKFLNSYFIYLKSNVLPMTRMAYLQDVTFFFEYLVSETSLTKAETAKDVTVEEMNKIKASDVNIYLDYCRQYEKVHGNSVYVYENGNRTLARKKSSISVLFKHLYRDELIEKNITDGFNPIRVPKAGEHEIKALQDNEVMIMLDAVSTGQGLTKKELQYWEKTKKRDKAILILFVTYGLRLSELQQLNVSSFNFDREEFIIYRKRDKESTMPLNRSVSEVILDYIKNERKETDPDEGLFLSLQGKRMSQRQIRELVKKYSAIGLKTSHKNGYSPHKLRATTATSLISRGNSIYDVQALLDHDQVTTTQLYAAHRANVKRDLVKNMEWEEDRVEGLNEDDEKAVLSSLDLEDFTDKKD